MRRTTPAKGSGLPVARGKCCRSASALSHGRSIDIKDPKPLRRLPEDKIMLGGRKSPHGERRLRNYIADIIHRNHASLMLASLCLAPSDIFGFQHIFNALSMAFPQLSHKPCRPWPRWRWSISDLATIPIPQASFTRRLARQVRLHRWFQAKAGFQPHCWDFTF